MRHEALRAGGKSETFALFEVRSPAADDLRLGPLETKRASARHSRKEGVSFFSAYEGAGGRRHKTGRRGTMQRPIRGKKHHFSACDTLRHEARKMVTKNAPKSLETNGPCDGVCSHVTHLGHFHERAVTGKKPVPASNTLALYGRGVLHIETWKKGIRGTDAASLRPA